MMKKKRILIVLHQLNHGGVQKSLLTALNVIDYKQNDVTLYVRKNRVQLIDEVNKNVNKVIVNRDSTHYYRKPYVIFLLLRSVIYKVVGNEKKKESIHQKIVAYINQSQMEYEQKHYFAGQNEYDVAISYMQGYTAKFVAEYIRAKKKVMFFHGSTDEVHELHQQILPQFNVIVGVNENIQEILAELYPVYKEKMTYIENYVDVEEIRYKSKEYNIEKREGKILVCTCGRLAAVKGFDLALKAAKMLKEKGIGFYWYFVGDGPDRTKLEMMIEDNNLGECIKITGMQSNPYPYIANCDIYVQSSYEEAQPLTIIEAMVLGRPVVTTATVGGSNLVTDGVNGLVVDINEDALADGIIKILANKTYQKMMCYLENVDYSKDFMIYKKRWKDLLEV